MRAEEVSDEALVARLRSNDAEALRQLLERYRRPLFGYLHRLLDSREDAEDLFQEAFLRVVRHATRFDTERSFRPWLYSIATNLVKNKYRARSYRSAVSLDKPDEDGNTLAHHLASRASSPREKVEQLERAQEVQRLVGELPERGRAALVLYYYQGLSYQEVSSVLEIPLGTVKSRIHNALSRLGRVLAAKEEQL